VQRISADAYIPAYLSVIGAVPKPASEDYAPRITRGEVWLLENDGDTSGLIVLEPRGDHLLIYSVAVDPRAQRRGHGKTLLMFADERARELGLREVRLYTNVRMAANVRLYRACGFAEIGTRPHPSRPGEFLVDMGKRLGP
jgi:ribosomal protein S18 acetylase RimI-like enzyme